MNRRNVVAIEATWSDLWLSFVECYMCYFFILRRICGRITDVGSVTEQIMLLENIGTSVLVSKNQVLSFALWILIGVR